MRLPRRATALPAWAVAVPLVLALALSAAGPERHKAERYSTGSALLPILRTWLQGHDAQVTTLWVDQRTGRLMPLYTHSRYRGELVWHGQVKVLTAGGPRPGAGDYGPAAWKAGRAPCAGRP